MADSEAIKETKAEIKQEVKMLKEAKEEMKEASQELRETKAELNEVKQEMKKAERDRLAIAREIEREVANRIVTVMTTALALVAGLFWQTAINDTIKTFIPVSGAWQYEIVVALVVTVLAAFMIYALSKSADGIRK